MFQAKINSVFQGKKMHAWFSSRTSQNTKNFIIHCVVASSFRQLKTTTEKPVDKSKAIWEYPQRENIGFVGRIIIFPLPDLGTLFFLRQLWAFYVCILCISLFLDCRLVYFGKCCIRSVVSGKLKGVWMKQRWFHFHNAHPPWGCSVRFVIASITSAILWPSVTSAVQMTLTCILLDYSELFGELRSLRK